MAVDRGGGRPNLPSKFNSGSAPLLVRLEEEASMVLYTKFDESWVNVVGSQEIVLELRTLNLVIMKIAPDRASKTIGRLFWRP